MLSKPAVIVTRLDTLQLLLGLARRVGLLDDILLIALTLDCKNYL